MLRTLQFAVSKIVDSKLLTHEQDLLPMPLVSIGQLSSSLSSPSSSSSSSSVY